ncbi:hypothetical protein E2C01_097068 [Portunus trituberculatus]|uniref:Uncharacterized protein n=1 Tax=Portunus trituberculatus TaxID=210409 RepID=A0A5B7K3M7_PORTR|nr:hypothetical protein [Portunus trituberculatus]
MKKLDGYRIIPSLSVSTWYLHFPHSLASSPLLSLSASLPSLPPSPSSGRRSSSSSSQPIRLIVFRVRH